VSAIDTALDDLALLAKLVGIVYPPAAIVAVGLGAAADVVAAAEKLLPSLAYGLASGTATDAQRDAASTIVSGSEPAFPLEQGEREPWMW
jgi:hypothetical protein